MESEHQHFRRPLERPFFAQERDSVTILIGGLTWTHERLIRAVFLGCGYRCETLPACDLRAYQVGREYCNTGLCNPSYFTIGNLIRHLHNLEKHGLTRDEISNRYVFFTAGSCGPCRFGMYESEYRLALQNAGFGGFRVLTFQQQQGWQAASGEPGLTFSVDLGMGMLNAIILGDIVRDIAYRLRPYEARPRQTDQVIQSVVAKLESSLRDQPRFELSESLVPAISHHLAARRDAKAYKFANTLGKIRSHLRGRHYRSTLLECRDILAGIEVDRLRVMPVVKVVGEFWAQLTEGPGNYNLFAFLEREGAELLLDPISTWAMYLLYLPKIEGWTKSRLEYEHDDRTTRVRLRPPDWPHVRKQLLLFSGQKVYEGHYRKAAEMLGNIAQHLLPQEFVADLAHPHYHRLARGGEGYLEVGKSLYYTRSGLCHMVLAVKPFGCMPSTQSDAIHWAEMSRSKNMLFVSIETSGEGEINALSRVQLALADARTKAQEEFDACLRLTGLTMERIRDYVATHVELRDPFYVISKHPGTVGTAANFVLQVAGLMSRSNKRARAAA